MSPPSWDQLLRYHCSLKYLATPKKTTPNPLYEDMSTRRYNYVGQSDMSRCRLIFLKDVLDNTDNKTLVRGGRFLWCGGLQYEGRAPTGLRSISFSVDKGKKRFVVPENNILCIPAKTFVNNNRYFRRKDTTFTGFSSVFGYENTMRMMWKSSGLERPDFTALIRSDNPYNPGTLVSPRLGYFYPTASPPHASESQHPYGLILGSGLNNNDYSGREFYRVKFGRTIYERVHPIQLEIVNEV